MALHYEQIKASPLICTDKKSVSEWKTANNKSVLKMLDQVMQQVEYNCFTDLNLNHTDPLFKELCLIIAEVLVLDKDSVIKINGSFVSTCLVQEVYSLIHNEHVDLVFDNFKKVSQRIYNKKGYLRTALYNAVFEIESGNVNDTRHL